MNDRSSIEAPHSEKREEIITEAIRQFNQNGFADTRLEDIGAKLGTVKTSVSYHFRSKDGLLEVVCDRALSFSEEAIARAHDHPIAWEGLASWLKAHAMAHAQALGGIARPLALIDEIPLTNLEPNPEDDIPERSLLSRHSRLIGQCRALIERGAGDGSIRVTSVPASLFFLLNIVHWLPRWLADVRPADYELAITAMLDTLGGGLAAQPDRQSARAIIRNSIDGVEAVFNRAARNRAKREAFLRAGARALNETGYRSLSLNEVAAELGVTRGAFYYHIADKEALLAGCFARSLDLIQTAQTLAPNDDIDGLGMIERSTRWLFERQLSNLDPLTDLRLLSALPVAQRQVVVSRLAGLRARFGSMLATGMGDGSIRAIDVATVEHLVLGAIFLGSHRRQTLVQAHMADKSAMAENISSAAYFDVLWNGFKAKA